MNIEEIRDYCLAKNEVTESFPFGDDTLVFKVKNKMFALMNLEGDLRINLKCDPEEAVRLRERFPAVTPGYHMNKRLWNTIAADESISDEWLKKQIDESYRLVVQTLLAKEREALL